MPYQGDKLLVSPILTARLTHQLSGMKIFGALGFGVLLLVLATMMPPVLSELATTLVVILKSTAQAFAAAGQVAASAAYR